MVTCNSYFGVTLKIKRFTILHYVSSKNSKNANHRYISLTETDHCYPKLSKDIQFEKNNDSVF